MKTVFAGLLIVLASVSALAGNAAGGEAWWNPDWKARRIYEIAGRHFGLPGDEVGVVEFHTGGLSLTDGRDVRVLARGGKLLPVKILATGPGDLLRVCFPLVREVASYHLYYGNAEAKATETFVPRRGVLLASRGFKGGSVDSWRGMQGVIGLAKPSYGRGFVDRIFHGYNPFGPQTNYVNKYTAWLKTPVDGEYLFATSSDDASFLFVDGKKVCEWPGWHGAIAQVRPNLSGKVQLKKGLVKLEYWHVNGELTGVAVAAWKAPGAKRAVTIPADAFAPVCRGRLQSFSLRDGELPVEIAVRSAGEAFIDERDYLVRATFSARLGPEGKLKARSCNWDFGDGQSGTGAAPEHVYLLPGVYAVKLTVVVGKRKRQWTERLNIDRDMRRAIAGRSEDLKAYLPELARRDLGRTDPQALLRLARLYEKVGDLNGQLRVARELLSRGAKVSDEDYFQQLVGTVQELRKEEHGKEGRTEAIKLLAAAEERFRGNPRQQSYRAKVIRERGDVYYFYAGDLEKAYNEYDKVVTRFQGLEDNIVRITKIRIGDIHRERGKYQEAARRYQQAEKLKLTDQAGVRGEARRGALPHMAEDFLRRRRYKHCEEVLNVWEWEYPMEKLRGYSTLLRTELELARKNYEEVVKLAKVMLKVNPRTNFAGELLTNQARAHQRSGRPAEALECLRRLVEKYPESKEAPAAREALAKAAGKKRRK